mgnify:CR=1 FL=1
MTNTGKTTVEVDLGGKPKLLMCVMDVDNFYTYSFYDGENVTVMRHATNNAYYGAHEVIEITDNGFTWYNDYPYAWYCEYYAVIE